MIYYQLYYNSWSTTIFTIWATTNCTTTDLQPIVQLIYNQLNNKLSTTNWTTNDLQLICNNLCYNRWSTTGNFNSWTTAVDLQQFKLQYLIYNHLNYNSWTTIKCTNTVNLQPIVLQHMVDN